ncbi:iron ABC transporter permease [Alkalilimnicola ehrlichii]|uniref:Iron ABC transporter permease n=1 Tax=Alkalilimnicola ehrlichii TaxID=351052 RepID=A0A3E0X271_9GAMM|nr:iron ABC transporter permease [Alkalilimnicola ehrlichii]RFA29002.1 iron ABC transporter permease [Alkalilimnicola ehrlichii]RFA38638.1 iron ABC transporter permease [Alkalilimnicola ehrlichii]
MNARIESLPQTKPRLADDYRHFVRYRRIALTVMALVLLISLLFDIATGPSVFPITELVRGLWDPSSLSAGQAVILYDVRLPYALMAVLVGASLGLAGAEMQTVLNNPLASPFTLGISAAATLGASLAILLDLSLFGLGQMYAVPMMAFGFAVLATLLILALAHSQGAGVETVILFGIALLFTFEALVWLVHFLADTDTLQQIVFWSMGSLSRATWENIAIVAVVFTFCMVLSARSVWAMTALRSGEDQALSFGLSVAKLRLVVLLRVSLLAATAVAFVGVIGFVGLVGPHIARLALGEDHRFYLLGSALAGAIMLSLASIASKVIIPGVIIPIGIVTALVGVPLFMLLILGRGRRV